MTRWFFIPAIGALLVLGGCADGGIGATQVTKADLNEQAALTACKTEVYGEPPLPNGDDSFRLPGEPHGCSIYWYEGTDRHIDHCLAEQAQAQAASQAKARAS